MSNLLRMIDRVLTQEEIEALDKVDDVKIAYLGKNDIVVLKIEREITQDEMNYTLKIAEKIFSPNKIAILTGGMDMEILRREI